MKFFKKSLFLLNRIITLSSKLLPSKWLHKMNSDQRRFFNLIVTGIFLVVGTWVATSLLSPNKSDAAWFNDNWLYRQTVPISNSGSALTNAQIPITFDTATLITAGKMKSDCSDVRITNVTGDILKHWVHECNTATTKIYTWADVPTNSSELLIYYGNPSARDTEVITGTTQFPGISCKTILDHGDGSSNQQYTIDPNAGSGSDAFSAYCDMTTDSGGWTIVTSQNGTTSQQGLTSNNEVAGDPFSNASHNISTQKKQDLSLISSESLIKRSTGVWLKADDPLFDGNLTTANQHPHYSPITLTANDGTQVTDAVMGYSNYNNSNGGDFGIVNSVGFDHHNTTTYYHLNSGCQRSYLYKYGTTYNVNTAIGSWAVTTTCSASSTAMGAWYAGMRGTIAPTVANLTVSSPTNEEKSEGPIAYWSMDEGSGGTVNDNTQNGNNGTISGATWQEESMCLKGRCLFFDGTNDQVDFGDINNIPLTGDLTISFWMKPTNIAKGRQNPIGKAYSGEFDFTLETSGSLSYYQGALGGNASPFHSTGINASYISENRWNHVVMTRNNTSRTLTFFVNGVQTHTSTWTSDKDPSNSSRALKFGYEYVGFFQGYLDEVKMYATVKSIDQVQTDYNTGVSAVLGAKDANLNNGLVGYWKLEETPTATASAEDSSGSGNTGTSVDTSAVSGKYGNGRNFDGSGDYISVPTTSELNFTTNGTFSISLWIKPDTLTSAWRRGIIRTEDYLNSGYRFGMVNGGAPTFWTSQSGGTLSLTSSENLTINQWNHVTVTYSNQQAYIYLNGEQTGSATGTYIAGTNSTILGYLVNEYYSGAMDEVRIYNRALTPTDVQQLYNYAPPPIYYAPLEEGSGTTVNDLSGNEYTGSIIGSTPRWTQGKYGRALQFTNASGDRVSANTTSGPLTYLNNHTVGFWVKFTDLNDGTYRSVFHHQPTGSDRNPGIWTYASNGTLRLHWMTNPGNAGFSNLGVTGNGGTSFETNKWYYISATKNGSTATAYVNGVKVATGSFAEPMTQSTGLIRFGGGAGMIIDEIKVYDYPRTASQIIEDMNAGHPIGGSPVGSQVGYWDFNEGTGTTANNTGNSGSTYSGTISGASWSSGKSDKALSFTGTNTVTIPDGNGALDFSTDDFTISAWIKTSTVANNGNLIRKGAGDGLSGWRFGLANGIPTVLLGDTLGYSAGNVSSTSIADNEWHQVVIVYDRDGSAIGYVDGIQTGTRDISTRTGSIDNTSSIIIGNTYDTFTGLIDDVKIYNSALTAEQIKIDYNLGQSLQFGALGTNADGTPSNSSDRAYCPPGDTTATCGPVAEWKFEERQGTSTNDTSGNGLTGTLTGSPTWTTGKVGSALSFNGSSSYVDTAGVDTSSGNFSLSAWIYPTAYNASWKHIFGAESTGHALGMNGSNNLTLTRVSVSDATTSGYQPPLNTWTYVTVTFNDTTDELIYYANGQKILFTTYGGTMPTAGAKTRYIGRSPNYTSYFPGKIDEARIYNYVLSPSQVAWQYNRGEPVAYYDLDECQGTTIHSFTKPYNSALDGTLTIGATGTQTSAGTCQTSGTAWGNGASGKVNSSLSFDGTDDYFEISQPNITTSPNLFTVTGWIKPTNHDSFFITPNSTGIDQWIGYNGANQRMRVTVAQATDTNQTNVYSSIGSVPNDTWTHIAVVVNDRTVKIYVNGVLNTQSTMAFDISGWTSNWRIGQRGNSTFWYQGLMDDLKIFNYELTSQQIKTVMNQGAIRFGQ